MRGKAKAFFCCQSNTPSQAKRPTYNAESRRRAIPPQSRGAGACKPATCIRKGSFSSVSATSTRTMARGSRGGIGSMEISGSWTTTFDTVGESSIWLLGKGHPKKATATRVSLPSIIPSAKPMPTSRKSGFCNCLAWLGECSHACTNTLESATSMARFSAAPAKEYPTRSNQTHASSPLGPWCEKYPWATISSAFSCEACWSAAETRRGESPIFLRSALISSTTKCWLRLASSKLLSVFQTSSNNANTKTAPRPYIASAVFANKTVLITVYCTKEELPVPLYALCLGQERYT